MSVLAGTGRTAAGRGSQFSVLSSHSLQLRIEGVDNYNLFSITKLKKSKARPEPDSSGIPVFPVLSGHEKGFVYTRFFN